MGGAYRRGGRKKFLRKGLQNMNPPPYMHENQTNRLSFWWFFPVLKYFWVKLRFHDGKWNHLSFCPALKYFCIKIGHLTTPPLKLCQTCTTKCNRIWGTIFPSHLSAATEWRKQFLLGIAARPHILIWQVATTGVTQTSHNKVTKLCCYCGSPLPCARE